MLILNWTFGLYYRNLHDIKVRVFDDNNDPVFVQAINDAIIQNVGTKNLDSIFEECILKNSSKSPSSKMGLVISAVLNGGSAGSFSNSSAETFGYDFSYPTEYNTSYLGTDNSLAYLSFSDLAISFSKYGSYRLVFEVDGIETVLSNIITVAPEAESFKDRVKFLLKSS